MGGIVLKSKLTASDAAKRLSVVLITLNEEHNLKSLLPDIPAGAEIIIVDSGSTDATKVLAESFQAKFNHRDFDNYSSQKNYAMALATRPWTLCLDADERPDEILWHSILDAAGLETIDAYDLKRRLVFLGKHMTFGRTVDHLVRLFRTGSASYSNTIHERLNLAEGSRRGTLNGVLWHHSYRSLTDYFARFNRYTSLMSEARYKKGISDPLAIILAIRLPLDFLVRYFIRLGFLDGWHGFLWAVLGSFYGFVKYAKVKELFAESSRQ